MPTLIRTIEHDRVGILQIKSIICHHAVRIFAVFDRRPYTDGSVKPIAVRLGAVPLATTAQKIEQVPFLSHVDNRTWAIVIIDALQLCGNIIERLIPANTLPLVNASFVAMGIIATTRLPALAFERILQAIDAENMLTQRMAARTRSHLRRFYGVILEVISLLAYHNAVHHVHLVQATSATVAPAFGGDPLASTFVDSCIRLDDVRLRVSSRIAERLFLCLGGTSREPRTGHGCRSGSRALQKVTTSNAFLK